MTATTQVRERPILFSGEMVRAILDGRKTQTRRVVNLDRLRVRARRRVTADYPFVTDPAGELVCAAGETYPGHIARYGAVSAVMPSGKQLGLKPGEFDFLCPYAHGKTVLTVEGEAQTWHILPSGGDRLWVREAWAPMDLDLAFSTEDPSLILYRADEEECLPGRWRPSIHMPRWASRILLEITDVRVERVQDISEEDARAEGAPMYVIGHGPISDGELAADPGYYRDNLYRNGFEDLWDRINGPRGYGWDANPWVWVVSFTPTTGGSQ